MGDVQSARDESDRPRLTAGHQQALQATDIFFGGFCALITLVAAVGWWRGEVPAITVFAVLGFLVANAVLSQVSIRTQHPYRVEVGRLVVGGVVAPVVFLLVDGPMEPWWQGFLIMALGGAIVLGLITQRAFWGQLIVAYYLVLYLAVTYWKYGEVDIYTFSMEAGTIAMVGLVFAKIMSLLGETLAKEHEKGEELAAARDALFAEMEIAQQIQTLMLPKAPAVAGTVVSGRMVTASEVGGDYYDVIEAPGGRTLLAIGDVSGHGVTSGLTMMMARTSLIGALEAKPEATIADLYRILNRAIRQNLRRMDLSNYMTFALFEYHGEGRFTAVGRHLPLMVYRAGADEVEEINLDGIWLGIVDDFAPEQLSLHEFQLGGGDLLFLYTDGVIEQFRGDEMFGFERLREVVRANAKGDPDKLITEVIEQVRAFNPILDDDVTMLVVNRDAAA